MAMAKTEDAEKVQKSASDLEADIQKLREDLAALTKQLAVMGGHSYGTAKRAAAEGVEQLRSQGEATIQNLKANARDLEEQIEASVREKPVTSLAIAAAAGFVFALLVRR